LVGFKKVWDLEASEKRKIEITIDPGASNHPLSFWDSRSQSWVMANGTYTLSAGNSSANTPVETSISIQQ
jgi:beta-glucosidase